MSTANIIGNAIFGLRNKSGGNYINPSVKESLVGVWIADQNTNESPTRNIIKNTIKDKGGDLELLNFGYKLNSGYGKYEEDFTDWRKINPIDSISSDSFYAVNIAPNLRTMLVRNHNTGDEMPQWKVMVSGLKGEIIYILRTESGNIRHQILSEGINILEKSYAYAGDDVVGFAFYPGASATITQIPSFEGALVTDGKDDLITSTKTVQEMLGGSNEITVVSMVHQIGLSSLTTINNIRSESVAHVVGRNICSSAGKTGIYGYSRQINTNNPPTLINNILGDKKDYTTEGNSALDPTDKFFVQGYKYSGTISEVSPIAYYWTFIANKVLTTDQINQVISYFNLDKHVKPDVYYDVKKQGLSNDTPEADWYLKDFSGNGHDMTLYNFAKKLGSGISKYEEDFTSWLIGTNINVTNDTIKAAGIVSSYVSTKVTPNSEIAPFTIKVTGIPKNGEIRYYYCSSSTKIDSFYIREDGQYNVPQSERWELTGSYRVGFTISNPSLDWSRLVIEQIPDYEGALVSDGIDDYGKVENLPIYKDYTVVADREIVDGLIDNVDGGVATRSYNYAKGAFGFDWKNQAFSFGGNTDRIIDVQRFISYQSKYVNNGIQLITGNVVDNNPLYMARLGEENRYSKLALWSFLLFPYTLSEFLLERQLKRYKLGTLYPGMIEWRPKVNINVPVVTPPTFSMNNGSDIITNGQYIPEGTEITIRIFTTTDSSVGGLNEATAKINGVDIELSPSGNKTYYGGKFIVSSKQKIDITIDEYIRYEDIVQPYPAIINLKQDGKTITWGDKLKVGSEVTFVNYTNLLPDLYTVSGGVQYNGTSISWNTSIRVEKSMVFVNPHSYKKANEPNCILAPQTLRIPNSSYKILGYIPDLTGKGNHGIINNSTYAGMSGANGYIEPFNDNKWHISSSANKINRTDNKITVVSLKANRGIIYVGTGTYVNEIKVIATGIPVGGELIFHQDTDITIPNNVIVTIGGKISTGSWEFIVNDLTLDWSNLVIEQLGQYEGSFCLDGVDDYITIPTLAHGGKQVLMKVNLQSYDRYLYDQRNNWSPYLAIVSAGKTIAYEYSNKGGKTYIDGILNEHIIDKDLLNITHNITATNANIGVQYAPNIGTSFARGNFAQMALFDFMLFPDISSEEEIKELNEVMGIEENLFLIHLKNDDTEIINETLILNE